MITTFKNIWKGDEKMAKDLMIRSRVVLNLLFLKDKLIIREFKFDSKMGIYGWHKNQLGNYLTQREIT